jgi:hypothetical protein
MPVQWLSPSKPKLKLGSDFARLPVDVDTPSPIEPSPLEGN